MKKVRLEDMLKGWFIGDFEPTLIRTNAVEVAIKEYEVGFMENRHYHKIATEITVITSGRVRMNNQEYKKGDIVVINPGESTDFEALEHAITTVIKYPGAKNDKYEGEFHD